MWDGADRIIKSIIERKPRKVYCNKKRDGKCYSARTSAPKTLIGEKVYMITETELTELKQYISAMSTLRQFFATILNSKKGSKMFNIVGETWNPITGCLHYCKYCWARQLALTKLKNTRRYRDGFKPRLNEEELRKSFKGGVVFVSDMGDIFSPGVKDEWIIRVIKHISKFPDTYFLFLTKNPTRYKDFIDIMPQNAILGATIETNRDDLYTEHRISQAPLPSIRYRAMKEIDWSLKFVSIEPILDFDLEVFTKWIKDIGPFMVYVGYDNYNWKLPEPPLSKTEKLIDMLSDFTLVIRKTIRPAWYEKQSIMSYTKRGGPIICQ